MNWIVHDPDMRDRMARLGMQGADMTRAQISDFQKAEAARWAAVIQAGDIELE
jgi:tripartite-type tricarboxylate transporter receptor subunit TctC